ncbi:MAG: hypothetical protein ACLQUT_06435 [Thermoleophilia bacterium]
MKTVKLPPETSRPWTTRELQALRAHAEEGLLALVVRLGRSPASVTMAAHRFRISLRRPGQRGGLVLGQPRHASLSRAQRRSMLDRLTATLTARNLAADLDPESQLCPLCAMRVVTVTSTGLCGVCHMKKLAEAHRDALAEIEAQRELLAARQQLHRARAEENA